MSLIGLSGSPTAPSRSAALLAAALHRLEPTAVAPVWTLRDLPAVAVLRADFNDPTLQVLRAQVAAADVVVLATPIYKAAYSGLLKSVLDLLPQDGLRHKTVWALATGGSPAHVLALEQALHPVLSALGAREFIDPVYAVDTQFTRDAQGAHVPDDAVRDRIDRAVADWQARHARPARKVTPSQPSLAPAA